MAKQTFTAGQVLTAAQQNSLQSNDYNQTVSTKTASYTLVAADAGTRVVMNAAGATTITVNTDLFTAGDTLVLQNIGAGTSTLTAGTATVSSAGPLAIPQYGSGTLYFTSTGVSIYFPSAVTASASTSGLAFITGATFSAANTVSLPNNTFSSTYRNYRIQLNVTDNSTDDTTLGLRMRSGGTDDATGYYGTIFGTTYLADTFRVTRSNNATSFAMANLRTTASFDATYSFDVLSPNVAVFTTWSGTAFTSIAGEGAGLAFAGVENSATQFDALSFIPGAGTITGVYRVYGYADS